jgi:HAD superfamily hydrolase (TIGR01509 family)
MSDISIKYALFDMDGTLTDTMDYWYTCIPEYLSKTGTFLTEEQQRAINSKGIADALAYVRSLGLSPSADAITKEDVARVLLRHYEQDAVAKPGVLAFLDGLRARGVKMGVATLTPEPLARACLARTGLLSYFSFVFGGDAYPEGKTEPRIFLDAAKEFGCAPVEMVLFEDSYYSIKTAREIGIPVVGVADKYQAHERERIMDAAIAFFDDGFTKRVK